MTGTSLARLLQLASATLPVGAYSCSQGLEWAVGSGAVRDEATAGEWIETVLEHGIAAWDAPWVAALMRASDRGDCAEVAALNERFIAGRETRELRAETVQTGRSLLDLLRDAGGLAPAALRGLQALDAGDGLAFPTAWSAVAVARGIAVEDALVGYLWSWLENSVLAALKTIPLGQRTGQRLLTRLGGRLDALAATAAACPLDRCHNLLPGFALASMHHETQYTRLFRS
jgi:urease accessory protein